MSEAEAAKAVMAEEMVRQSRQRMKDLFLSLNRTDLWDDMQQKMAEARKNRQEEVKRQEALARKKKKQLIEILIAIAICLGVVPVAIALVLWWATS
jgi:ADP-ribosylglycohydrolase